MNPQHIARYAVRLRESKGMSLRQLSRKASLSPASLSAIEKGQSSPTLATLQRILTALGTNLTRFFTDCSALTNSPVFRAKQMQSMADAVRNYTLVFPARADLRFEVIREVIRPTKVESEWEKLNCDIGCLVIEGGPLRLEVEGVGEWDVAQDDAFYIKAGQKHRGSNRSRKPLSLLSIISPPRY